MTGWRRGGPGAGALGVRFAPVLAAAVAGLGSAWAAASGTASVDPPTSMPFPAPASLPVPVPLPVPKPLPVPMPEDKAKAMAGTERYCVGYERTFHGEWETGRDRAVAGPPVLFRIGANSRGAGCYAQLNVRTPPGVAPYELPRFRAKAREGGTAWILRYREIVLEFDTKSGTVARRESGNVVRNGILFAGPPAVGEPPPPPPLRQRQRWYGRWRGRISGLPFPVTLSFSSAERGRVRGRISMLLMAENFTGRFHGEMLVFRWRNRHVGLHMEHGGDTLVYNDYRGRVFRFRRRR